MQRGFAYLIGLVCVLAASLWVIAPAYAQQSPPQFGGPSFSAPVGQAVWSENGRPLEGSEWAEPARSEPARSEPVWNEPAWDAPAAPQTSGSDSRELQTGGTQSAGTSAGTSGGTHIVQAGENLVSIARQYGLTPPQLVRVNDLGRPPAVYPGQTLVLPTGSEADVTPGWDAPALAEQLAAEQPEAASQSESSWGAPAWSDQTAPNASVGVPPAPGAVGKVILISTEHQYLWAYEDGDLVLQTPVTTGRPGADTPKGTYPILVKYSPYRFVSPFPEGHEFYYEPVDSNYSMRITWEGHHIHDAPWRTDFGPGTNLPHNNSRGQLATGSIGCVNVPTSVMAQLYEWADEGIQVTVE